ncbi:MAG: IS200/IS605 family transposase [Lachnospiraceae bacterium]|nr:IS200/IS605 family transposase [Lachnospiraceae bacterium]
MSKVSAYYHIVFCTKERRMVLPLEYLDDIYRFINNELSTAKCPLLRIGGIQNHVHLLIDLHPSVALSTLMQNIKSHTGGWLRKDARFPLFDGWAREYYAASISATHKEPVIEYIKNQRQHHLGTSFDDELTKMYQKSNLSYDDRDLR